MRKAQTILVPVDFTESSHKALDYALPLAESLQASIVLLHVVDRIYAEGFLDTPAKRNVRTEAHRGAREKLDAGAKSKSDRLVPIRHVVRHGVPEYEILRLAESMDVVFDDGDTWLGDEAVTEKVRSEPVGNRASEVARLPAVRQALLRRQRAFRRPPGLVADGRDMATVVFPDAELKVFLTADSEIRAERRYKQLIEKGIDANLRALSRDLEERDARDASRAVAPLVPAPDAQVLDSSALSVEAVVESILRRYRERTSGSH